MATNPIRYENKPAKHPDDENEPDTEALDCEPRDGEVIADVLRRTGAVGKAVRRLHQAMDAMLPQGWPDYRARAVASGVIRDTVEGTPDKRPAKAQSQASKPDAGGIKRGNPI